MIWFIWIMAVSASNSYYNYADQEVMSPSTRHILNQRMWSLDFNDIPAPILREIAIMYVQIKQGRVYTQCFGLYHGYFK